MRQTRKKFMFISFIMAIFMIVVFPLNSMAHDVHAVDNLATVVVTEPAEQIVPRDNLFVNSRASNSVRYLKLRVMLGDTYREDYSNPENEAATRVSYVDIPFISTWSIGFTESFVYIGPLPIDYCSLSITSLCTDSACGSGCNNEINNRIHHKNSIKNLNKVRNDISDSGYDIMLTLVSTPMCGVWDNHATGILGVTYLNDNYTLLTNASSISTNVRVRIMQHEICHMFSCNDGVCTSGADCIMNGGYDGRSLYTSDIWCSSCEGDFNPNAQ